MSKSLRIGIVVGEASGDILGAALMQAILRHHPDTVFEGIGGPRMIALGFNSLFAMERLSVMGLIDPLKRLFELLSIRSSLKQSFTDSPPDVFIGIDSPDFVLNIEQHLKQQGIASVHYVSPSVWAWRKKRIFKIKKCVDLMLTLFPFETEIYKQHNIDVEFVGHPLADQISMHNDRDSVRSALGLSIAVDKSSALITLMPGSRGSEVKMLGDLYMQVAQRCLQQQPHWQFLIPAANPQLKIRLDQMLLQRPQLAKSLTVIDGQSQQLMIAADAILMTSGTTTLEAMLIKRPMVVAYKMGAISYAIISRLVKLSYISLPNLLSNKMLVPEYIQARASVENLSTALLDVVKNKDQNKQLIEEFTVIHQQIKCDASERAALAILNLIEGKR